MVSAAVQVVPVDDDGRLAGFDGRGRRVDRHEVACFLELDEEVDARSDVVHRPAVGDRGHQHPVGRGAGGRGIAVEGDLALELGLEQVVEVLDFRDLGRVVADGAVAAVVVDPGTVRILELRRDVIERRDLVRREQVGVRQRDRLSQVEDVGRGALALLLVGGVDLVLAVGVGLGGVHLDAVLRGEGVDDLLVVGPIRRQRNHIEFTLGLGGLDQAVHPAEVGRRGGLLGVHTGLGLVAGVLLLGGRARHQSDDDEGGRGCGCEEP